MAEADREANAVAPDILDPGFRMLDQQAATVKSSIAHLASSSPFDLIPDRIHFGEIDIRQFLPPSF